MKNFKKLRIWQKGIELAINSYKFVDGLPKEEKFGLVKQITRAAVSIPSNIAEGCSRETEKDNARFIEIALGSSFELETQIIIAQALNFGQSILSDQQIKDISLLQRMISSYHSTLKGS